MLKGYYNKILFILLLVSNFQDYHIYVEVVLS